jgi:hypothetical protein
MGQKVNPLGLRLGINRTWDSRWYSKKNYAGNLHEDLNIHSPPWDSHREKRRGSGEYQ